MPKLRYRTFKASIRREKEEREHAEVQAEKDFKDGKTLQDNPYTEFNQNCAWGYKFRELLGYKWVLQVGTK